MANFFLEILMEEMPARLQDMAASQLKDKLEKKLQEENLPFKSLKTYVTPRRLVAHVEGLPEKQEDMKERKKGPRVDAPEKAVKGFLKNLNIKIEDCIKEKTPKGEFFMIDISHKGKKTSSILKSIVKNILESFFWPKSMRWGGHSGRWIRPVRHIILVFNEKMLEIEWNGIKSSNKTQGHRFLYPEFFSVKSWESYKNGLEKRKVILEKEEKRKIIQEGVSFLAKKARAGIKKPLKLIDEVSGLVEYPWFIKGSFDKKYLMLPEEVLETTMRVHQRYFLLYDDKKPLPFFVLVSNMPTDNEKITNEIRRGNEKVLTARLEDASFYWNLDREKPLKYFSLKLKDRLFHKDLGTMWQKKERLESLIESPFFTDYLQAKNISKRDATTAASLCKADLCTGIIAEFPELQGVMGSYYSKLSGENQQVSEAIKDHYNPTGPDSSCPEKPLSVALSLVDKIDTLVGFFSADLEPTSSKDPYALRRSALGLIRIILKNDLNFNIALILGESFDLYIKQGLTNKKQKNNSIEKIKNFLEERFKYYLKDKGYSYKIIEASLSNFSKKSLHEIEKDLIYMEDLLKTDEGDALLKTYRRINNIFCVKENVLETNTINKGKFTQKEEEKIFYALNQLEIEGFFEGNLDKKIEKLLGLKKVVNDFFENVLINSMDHDIKNNRICLIKKMKKLFDDTFPFFLVC